MTKITGIPRIIGMTVDWDAKRTSMTGLTGITTIMDKSHGTVMQYSFLSVISGFPHKTVHPF